MIITLLLYYDIACELIHRNILHVTCRLEYS